MLFILYTTGKCNLRCSYCGGSFNPEVVPWSVEYNLDYLKQLIREDDVVAFYGGEPFLNTDFIEKVMVNVEACRWVVQTNGLLFHKIRENILNRFDTILISIDGVKWLTDMYRGVGVYEKIIKNVEKIREFYNGDLVARMTVTENSDIYRDVRHLLSLRLFNHVHWQLNLVWSRKWSNLWSWIEDNYKPGLRRLMDYWIENLKKGIILGIAPFQGIMKRIVEDNFKAPPCGSGVDSFTILTDGRVVSCPIAVYEEWANVARLPTSREILQQYKPRLGEPCSSCSYFKICGGRCLYTHVERLWGEEGVEAVCETSTYIIDLVYENIDKITKILERTGIQLSEILYPEYNNTVEIIP
ncbi:MAG: TIGR04084 family radical SAM/SPASM domain-containing protein [Nitrososphaerota archaeon]|nr:TIGR04084 family radical SAM/SPASM domain-containing protein [Candidatus Geocrenenecus dongiae]